MGVEVTDGRHDEAARREEALVVGCELAPRERGQRLLLAEPGHAVRVVREVRRVEELDRPRRGVVVAMGERDQELAAALLDLVGREGRVAQHFQEELGALLDGASHELAAEPEGVSAREAVDVGRERLDGAAEALARVVTAAARQQPAMKLLMPLFSGRSSRSPPSVTARSATSGVAWCSSRPGVRRCRVSACARTDGARPRASRGSDDRRRRGERRGECLGLREMLGGLRADQHRGHVSGRK
jgi:hypothetical protein